VFFLILVHYNIHIGKLKVTINSIIKFVLSKSKSFSTKLIFNKLGVPTYVQYFDKIFLLINYYYLIYKHNHLLTNVNHNYNIRYKFNIDIVSSSNTTFGSQCKLVVGLNL